MCSKRRIFLGARGGSGAPWGPPVGPQVLLWSVPGALGRPLGSLGDLLGLAGGPLVGLGVSLGAVINPSF